MLQRDITTSLLKRWLVFNSVGLLGMFVQFGVLATLVSVCGMHYLGATFIAVETAVLHNFVWHERWTWADRRQGAKTSVPGRLLYFHLANGTISILGNMLLMVLFVEYFSIGFLPANGLSVVICSLLNFFAGDRIVFRSVREQAKTGEWDMHAQHSGKASYLVLFLTIFAFCRIPVAASAELKPETVKAWNTYVRKTEQRISRELESKNRFFVMDFQDKDEVLRERNDLLSGKIVIRSMLSQNGDLSGDVRGGKIHHWRGAVFIPGVDLDFVMSKVEEPESEDMAQEDVLASKVLERYPDGLKLFLKLQRSKIVTVVYNTEHNVRFKRYGALQASSSSVAKKIAEVESLDGGGERELPPGKDHGFLWRMNSYWRYRQVESGVIVECESLTLSRTVPIMLDYMIRPIINSIARESLERTLLSMRERMTRAS
jgi:putative flippase GtrA